MDPIESNLTNTTCFIPPLEAVDEENQLRLTILYTITSVIALVGNIVVIVVVYRSPMVQQNMGKFLINLAFSDIILGVFCVPFTYSDFMLGKWIWPHWLCPVAQYVQLWSAFVTSITLTVIGVERFLAMVIPFSKTYDWFSSHTKCILSIAWLLGSLYASPWAIYTGCYPYQWDNQTFYDCRFKNTTSTLHQTLVTLNFTVSFALPLVILITCYAAIGIRLFVDSGLLRRNYSRPPGQNKNKRQGQRNKVLSMLFVVIILYVLSWSPIKAYQLAQQMKPEWFVMCTEEQFTRFVRFFFTAHWLAMANSCVNPIVYSFMSKKFRDSATQIGQNMVDWLKGNRMTSGRRLTQTQDTRV